MKQGLRESPGWGKWWCSPGYDRFRFGASAGPEATRQKSQGTSRSPTNRLWTSVVGCCLEVNRVELVEFNADSDLVTLGEGSTQRAWQPFLWPSTLKPHDSVSPCMSLALNPPTSSPTPRLDRILQVFKERLLHKPRLVGAESLGLCVSCLRETSGWSYRC